MLCSRPTALNPAASPASHQEPQSRPSREAGSFIVKGFGRRQAYESRRGTNPRGRGKGLWGFRFSAGRGVGATSAGIRRRRWRRAGFCRYPAALSMWSAVAEAWQGGDGGRWPELPRRPKRRSREAWRVQAVPGHEAFLPVEVVPCGGARGWFQRAKASMTTMRPPQQGHGGRVSTVSSGVSS